MARNLKAEIRRRRLELWSLLPLVFLFIALNWILFRFYNVSEDTPISYALFYFGLINLNVLVFLAITFFLGRNLVKIYTEAKPRLVGKTLKARLFIAFVSFAFIPTFLMFLVSVFYINNSFDRWFANQTQSVIQNSGRLTNQYLTDIKANIFYIANQVAKKTKPSVDQNFLDQQVLDYGVDAIEYYNLKTPQILASVFSEKSGFYLPSLDWEQVKRDVSKGKIKSVTRKTEQGDWISAIIPLKEASSVLVVSKVLPFTLLNTMNSVIAARTDFQKTKEFKIPLKSSYLFILATMTLVILAFGGWFSLYLAESLSQSLLALGLATKRISKGDFKPIRFKTGMAEINDLVNNFNVMSLELQSAQESLNNTMLDLERHSIYMNTVLSQVTSGVISCGNDFLINFTNKKLRQLFDLEKENLAGKYAYEIFPKDVFNCLRELQKVDQEVLVRELDLIKSDQVEVPVQVSVARLYGVDEERIGYIVTVEKVDLLRENQRVKAWKEVATRVAHEIKNPLTPVKLSAERLQRKFSKSVSDPIFDQCIKTILYHVDLIKDLVNEFNQYARFPALKPESVDFSEFLTELISVYKTSHPNVLFDVGIADLKPVVFDKDQMKRVFINLIENSIDAMSNSVKKEIYIDVSYSKSGHVVVVKFCDSGPSVPEEHWQKVFQSRFTTKQSSSGLGLSITKKIIDEHGGRISILKGARAASVFVIELPDRKL